MAEAVITTEWVARPGAEEALGALLGELCRWARAEGGCLSHALLRDADRAGRFVTIGRYADARAAAGHRDTPHFRALVLGAAIPLLADHRPSEWRAA
jgi:quinol monooxygenase YgiN